MRRIGLAAVLLAGVAAPAAEAASVTPPASTTPPALPCSEQSWTGGATEWCDGTFVYRDYVYDDNGADTSPGSPHGTNLNRATGDVDHRDHGQSLNSADLLALRLSRTTGGRLHARFELNTLLPTDRTTAVLAIDTDNDDLTGSTNLRPFAVQAPGIDELHVFEARDPDPSDPALGGVIEGEIPMPPSPAGEWDLYAFTALADGTVMNVAFRGTSETGSWWEAGQADALAAGTIAPFKGELTPGDLGAGGRHEPATPRTGFHERVYRSAFAIGTDQEGVDDERSYTGRTNASSFGQYFQYLGHHQPYGIYVPPGDRNRPYGMQLALHGYDAAHASLVANRGMQTQLGDDLHRIVVVPLGRGPAGYYSDWSERDVLDVIADVRAAYPVDGDRIFAGGYSMGGYGALRLAALHPDLFAGVISWVGFTGDCMNGTPFAAGDPCPTGAVGNVLRYLDNLRHIPAANVYAAADELVAVHTANALRERFAALGYAHVFWLHAAEHLTFALLDDWAKEAAWTKDVVRVHDPARVTFRTNTYLDSGALGIVHDRAYWVRDLRPANGAADAVVDLLSHAGGCSSSTERMRSITNGAGPSPVPWVSQEAVDAGAAGVEPGPQITGTLQNVASLMLDTSSPCVTGDLSRVTTDTTTTVRFTDGRQPVILTP